MTDEVVETQAPKRRITDPAEALAALERALPGLTAHRRRRPATVDWRLIEEGLGTSLPPDYRHLAEWYPPFAMGDHILVGLPRPGEEHHRLAGIRETLEVLADAWLEPELGLDVHPAPGGLLPWAESDEGDQFLWSTTGATPQEWHVTVAGRGGAWWHYAGGAVQFLAGLREGTVEPWGLRLTGPVGTTSVTPVRRP